MQWELELTIIEQSYAEINHFYFSFSAFGAFNDIVGNSLSPILGKTFIFPFMN